MNVILCHQCGRPNSARTARCIWCSVAIPGERSADGFEPISVELEYVEGIDRLEDAGPVRFLLTSDRIEIRELMPGSRAVRIPIESVIEARVSRAPAFETRWPVLEIEYRLHDDIRTAVFCREGANGAAVVEGLAGRLSELIHARPGKEAN